MLIKLNDGKEIPILLVTGGNRVVFGSNRDTITFVINGYNSLEEIDNIFTEDNCENIILIQDDEEKTETLLYGYVLKTDLNKKIIEIAPESPEEEAVFEPRINITLARRSYAETKMAALSLAIDMLCMEDADNV